MFLYFIQDKERMFLLSAKGDDDAWNMIQCYTDPGSFNRLIGGAMRFELALQYTKSCLIQVLEDL
jgi:hypothetical protein